MMNKRQGLIAYSAVTGRLRTLVFEVSVFKSVIYSFYKMVQTPHNLCNKASKSDEQRRVHGANAITHAIGQL